MWPRPPFHPWTAMTVACGLMIPRLRALRRPNLWYQKPLLNIQPNLPDTVVNVNLPLVGGDTSWLRVVNRVDTSRKVELTGGLLASGDCWLDTAQQGRPKQHTTDNGTLRSVLGDKTGRVTRGREDDDGTGVLLDSGSDGGESESLGSLGRSRSERTELVEQGLVGNGRLGNVRGLGHHLD